MLIEQINKWKLSRDKTRRLYVKLVLSDYNVTYYFKYLIDPVVIKDMDMKSHIESIFPVHLSYKISQTSGTQRYLMKIYQMMMMQFPNDSTCGL